jgi:hypothetical protein
VHDQPRRCGDDVEVEAESVDSVPQEVREQRDVALEADVLADFDEIFLANAAEIRTRGRLF